MKIERILCPADFSDASAHAIEQAIAIAGWYQARVARYVRNLERPIYRARQDELDKPGFARDLLLTLTESARSNRQE
jgi:nucleotide-binding universal stress UspA family protein